MHLPTAVRCDLLLSDLIWSELVRAFAKALNNLKPRFLFNTLFQNFSVACFEFKMNNLFKIAASGFTHWLSNGIKRPCGLQICPPVFSHAALQDVLLSQLSWNKSVIVTIKWDVFSPDTFSEDIGPVKMCWRNYRDPGVGKNECHQVLGLARAIRSVYHP